MKNFAISRKFLSGAFSLLTLFFVSYAVLSSSVFLIQDTHAQITEPTCANSGGVCWTGTCTAPSIDEGPRTDCAQGQTCCVAAAPDPDDPASDAGGLVPCGSADSPDAADDCDFNYFIELVQRVMNFLLFVVAVPFAAISFAWAGWLYLSAAGNEGKVKEAHQIFASVVLGLCLALAAWLIVRAIITGLGVSTEYDFLGA